MKPKFIKYGESQVNLAEIYRLSGSFPDSDDVQRGTLVVGAYANGKYIGMGYLCGITREQPSGNVFYHVQNAVGADDYVLMIEKPRKVDNTALPYLASYSNDHRVLIVGKVVDCNGELATIYDGELHVVNVGTIHTLEPYFKETSK